MTKKDILNLVNEHNVTGAEDLYARRFELPLREVFREFLVYARVGKSAIPMDKEETDTIVNRFRAVAADLDLDFQPVGSLRRGRVGGHDLDLLFCPRALKNNDDDVPAQVELDNAARDALMTRIHAAYRKLGGLAPVVGAGHGKVKHGASADRTLTSHVVVESPKIDGAYRHVDLVVTPRSLWPHALLHWSGSRTFVRCFHDYVNRLREKNWQGGPERRGVKGWRLDPNENRLGPPVFERQLEDGEHWHWSSNGVYVATGNFYNANVTKVYEESNASFPDEHSIFRFFFLDYLEPSERCA
mmetsp:Transcript_11639/g.38292  ORF Transcript_11639/g.38292 Transcript_11639/m.38292 type:complete len:300 (+) Transcript_11639:948-1847(+)